MIGSTKYPEFDDLETHVWEYLRRPGQTISSINKSHGKKYPGLARHAGEKDDAVWYCKPDLDAYVAGTIGKSMRDYGRVMRNNRLYERLVNIVRELRVAGVLVDWDLTARWGTGVGIWKLDKCRLEHFAMQKIKGEMKGRDFAARGAACTIRVRLKQQEFRSALLKEYGKCVFCGFDVENHMIGRTSCRTLSCKNTIPATR